MPNLAQVYARHVADLRRAMDAGKQTEVLEAARALIDKVIVTPATGPMIRQGSNWSAISWPCSRLPKPSRWDQTP